jgi:hypothetical protein
VRRPAAFSRAWWQESGLSAMLVFLVLALFVGLPLEASGIVSPTLIGVTMTLLFLAGVVAMSGRGPVTVGLAAVALSSLTLRWASVVLRIRSLQIVDTAFAIVVMALLTAFVLMRVFREGPITGDRIRGAVVAYLLIGVIWCLAYQLVDFTSSGALRFPEERRPDLGRLDAELTYYSFITLTTVGYGDITPVSPLARMLAVSEALIGQLYPAILIGRLVSLQISSRPGGASR